MCVYVPRTEEELIRKWKESREKMTSDYKKKRKDVSAILEDRDGVYVCVCA